MKQLRHWSSFYPSTFHDSTLVDLAKCQYSFFHKHTHRFTYRHTHTLTYLIDWNKSVFVVDCGNNICYIQWTNPCSHSHIRREQRLILSSSYLQHIDVIYIISRNASKCSVHCAAQRVAWEIPLTFKTLPGSLQAHIKGSPTWCLFANCAVWLDYWSVQEACIKWPP